MTTTTRSPSVFAALYGLVLRSIASKQRLAGFGAAAIFLLVAAVIVTRSTDFGFARAAVDFVNGYGLFLLLPFACLLFGIAAFGDMREDRTMVYMWLRPIPTWKPVFAAYGAVLTAAVPFTVGAISASAAIIGTDAAFTGAVVATVLGTVAYSAVFLALGLRVRRALVWGALYVLIWEGFIAQIGGVPARLAIRTYTRSAMVHIADVEPDFSESALATSIIVPLAVAVAALVYTTYRFRTQDVD